MVVIVVPPNAQVKQEGVFEGKEEMAATMELATDGCVWLRGWKRGQGIHSLILLRHAGPRCCTP